MNPRAVLGCCLLGPVVAGALLLHGNLRDPPTQEPRFPALPPLPSACPVAAGERDGWVERHAAEVDGLVRRYSVDARVGVRASALLAELAACGSAAAASAWAARASTLRARIERDYRAHRVGLWAALEREDWPAVSGQVTWLDRLIAEPPADLSTWLRGLERRAEARGK